MYAPEALLVVSQIKAKSWKFARYNFSVAGFSCSENNWKWTNMRKTALKRWFLKHDLGSNLWTRIKKVSIHTEKNIWWIKQNHNWVRNVTFGLQAAPEERACCYLIQNRDYTIRVYALRNVIMQDKLDGNLFKISSDTKISNKLGWQKVVLSLNWSEFILWVPWSFVAINQIVFEIFPSGVAHQRVHAFPAVYKWKFLFCSVSLIMPDLIFRFHFTVKHTALEQQPTSYGGDTTAEPAKSLFKLWLTCDNTFQNLSLRFTDSLWCNF